MKTISVWKASGIEEDEIESVTLIVNNEVPSFNGYSDYESIYRDVFDSDAATIVDFLVTTLPQGTVDRVLARLCAKKASLFVIPLEKR